VDGTCPRRLKGQKQWNRRGLAIHQLVVLRSKYVQSDGRTPAWALDARVRTFSSEASAQAGLLYTSAVGGTMLLCVCVCV